MGDSGRMSLRVRGGEMPQDGVHVCEKKQANERGRLRMLKTWKEVEE